jgi:hypothetical protein
MVTTDVASTGKEGEVGGVSKAEGSLIFRFSLVSTCQPRRDS